jgi:hypothetical protein
MFLDLFSFFPTSFLVTSSALLRFSPAEFSGNFKQQTTYKELIVRVAVRK